MSSPAFEIRSLKRVFNSSTEPFCCQIDFNCHISSFALAAATASAAAEVADMVVGNDSGSGDDDDDVIMSQVPMGTFLWYLYPQAQVQVLGGYRYRWTLSYPWVTCDGP